MFNGDGSEANLGYGNYLVSVRLVGGNWDANPPPSSPQEVIITNFEFRP